MAILLKALIKKYAPERAKKRTSPYFTDFEVWKSVHASYMHYKNDSDKARRQEVHLQNVQKTVQNCIHPLQSLWSEL